MELVPPVTPPGPDDDSPRSRLGRRFLLPLALGGSALAVAVLAAAMLQALAASVLGDIVLAPTSGRGLAAVPFLVQALCTECGLLFGAWLALRVSSGSLHLRLHREHLAASAVGFAALLSINMAGAWAMGLTGESYSGVPEIPWDLSGLGVVLAATLAAPVVEELFFREALLRRIFREWPPIPAALVTSAAFGALHAQVGGLVLVASLAAMGLVLSWVRSSTGSLGPAILVHAANNCVALALSSLAAP